MKDRGFCTLTQRDTGQPFYLRMSEIRAIECDGNKGSKIYTSIWGEPYHVEEPPEEVNWGIGDWYEFCLWIAKKLHVAKGGNPEDFSDDRFSERLKLIKEIHVQWKEETGRTNEET